MKVLVGAATFKAHLDVFLLLSLVWWGLLKVNHSTGVHKWIRRNALTWSELTSLVCVERAGEFITIVDAEDTLVEADISANVKVSPGVRLNMAWLGNKMSLKEDTLGNTRVGNASLQNVNSIILKIIVHSALA